MLTADLPLARPGDRRDPGRRPAAPSAVLVPSHDGTGTNAMLLRPPRAIAPRLGPARWRATWPRPPAAGWPSAARARLALDIDTPRDLAALIARGDGRHGLAACAVAERLAAGSAL